jgi:hypothetical protein
MLVARRQHARLEGSDEQMSIEGIFIGIIGLVLGAAFTFGGFRWFLLLLPIWGLFVGFTAGADAVSTLLGEGFLSGALAIGVGIVLAIVFALLSYFYWWGAIAILAGWLGYEAVHWLLVAIGFEATGFLPFIISLAAGAVVAVAALLVNAPKLIAIILTSFAGAAWAVAGFALVFGIIKPDELTTGPLAAVYTQGWIWIIAWGVLGAAGVIEQMMTTARVERDLVAVYSQRNPM